MRSSSRRRAHHLLVLTICSVGVGVSPVIVKIDGFTTEVPAAVENVLGCPRSGSPRATGLLSTARNDGDASESPTKMGDGDEATLHKQQRVDRKHVVLGRGGGGDEIGGFEAPETAPTASGCDGDESADQSPV